MDLKIYLQDKAEWLARILEQEGLPFEQCDGKLSDSKTEADIVASFENSQPYTNAKFVITNHKNLAKRIGKSSKAVRSTMFVNGTYRGHFFANIMSADLRALDDHLEIGFHLDKHGQRVPFSGLVIARLDGQTLLSLPWDMTKFPAHWSRWPLYVNRYSSQELVFTEVAPRVDDRAVRLAVFRALVLCYQRLGAPLVRVSPKIPGRGLIALRIDADGFTAESTAKVASSTSSVSIPVSWFIDGWSWKNNGKDILNLAKGNEIGLHCFYHSTSIWERSNSINIDRGTSLLKRLGIEIVGYVAPFGHWNVGLQRALNSREISYSSEFGYSVDCLPITAHTNQRSAAKQIPTIPTSLGVWSAEDDYWRFLEREVEGRLKCSGFAIIYDHPIGRLENQTAELEKLVQNLKSSGYEFVTIGEINRVISLRPRLTSVEWDGRKVQWRTESEDHFGYAIEEILTDQVAGQTRSQELEAGSMLFQNFSVNWRKTIFFGFLASIPIELHLGWAELRKLGLRALKQLAFNGFRA